MWELSKYERILQRTECWLWHVTSGFLQISALEEIAADKLFHRQVQMTFTEDAQL